MTDLWARARVKSPSTEWTPEPVIRGSGSQMDMPPWCLMAWPLLCTLRNHRQFLCRTQEICNHWEERERGKVEKSMPPWNLPSSKSRGSITFITAQRLAPKNSIPRKPDRPCLPCPLLARLWSSHVNHSYRHAHVQGRGTASTFN